MFGVDKKIVGFSGRKKVISPDCVYIEILDVLNFTNFYYQNHRIFAQFFLEGEGESNITVFASNFPQNGLYCENF